MSSPIILSTIAVREVHALEDNFCVEKPGIMNIFDEKFVNKMDNVVSVIEAYCCITSMGFSREY
jgi:hypothetical protein